MKNIPEEDKSIIGEKIKNQMYKINLCKFDRSQLFIQPCNAEKGN